MQNNNETSIHMVFVGAGLYIRTKIWSVADKEYVDAYLTFDTGSSVSTLPPENFVRLGYEPAYRSKIPLITASKSEDTSVFAVDKIMIGDFEIHDVEFHSLKFPIEGFSVGVIGLNVLRHFDIELLFSKGIIKLKKL